MSGHPAIVAIERADFQLGLQIGRQQATLDRFQDLLRAEIIKMDDLLREQQKLSHAKHLLLQALGTDNQ